MCACRLTENEHKKRQKVQKEKDEIWPKITGKKWKIENQHPCIALEVNTLAQCNSSGGGRQIRETVWGRQVVSKATDLCQG